MSAYDSREPDQVEGLAPPECQALVGHQRAVAALRGQLNARRLPGSILLHGPRGIGKATLAFQFAREILEATGDESPPHIAAQVAAGAHPNLLVLRRVARDTGRGFFTAIRVDEVRYAIERLHHTRGREGYRVVVVDPIDDANPNAANALLKILEEPPPETLFLLVSHRPGSLLPTIRSRCHARPLRPLDDAEVCEVVAGNRPELAAADVAAAAALAQGSPRRAFEALLLGDTEALRGLKAWLDHPAPQPVSVHLGLANALTARDSAGARFAREVVLGWLAAEARAAAVAGTRRRLASANELWEKAIALFADTDEYNLDARQSLVVVFDAIKGHAQSHAPSEQA